jgi:hypothetical protein
MYPLPGSRGFVEIKSEANAPARGARDRTRSSTIAATFYGTDGSTAMSPPPTDVSVKLGTEEANQTVALSPSPGEAKSPSRFASAEGKYPDAPRGTIVFKMNGDQVEVPFSAR